MTLKIDLLGLACAEYIELDGVKGVFIPETPNFTFIPSTGYRRKATRPRAFICLQLLKPASKKNYDWMGRQTIPKEHFGEYMSNPNMVSRKAWCAYGYNYKSGPSSITDVSTAADFEELLED